MRAHVHNLLSFSFRALVRRKGRGGWVLGRWEMSGYLLSCNVWSGHLPWRYLLPIRAREKDKERKQARFPETFILTTDPLTGAHNKVPQVNEEISERLSMQLSIILSSFSFYLRQCTSFPFDGGD